MNLTQLISGVLLTVALWACGSRAEKPTKPTVEADETAVPIKLSAVTTLVRAEPIVASGLMSSSEEAKLSFKIPGIINRMYVKEGEPVHKGQLLATLNLTEIDAQVSQAQFGVDKADRDLNRVKALYADTASTLEQLQNATTGQNLAKQNLTIAQFNRSYAQIRSTVDGTVTRKLMNEGEYATAGTGVFTISSNRRSDWVVRVGVADKDWARLKPGDRAAVVLDAYPNQPFSGSVSKLAQAADPLNKLYEIEIQINPGATRFAPGLFAKVTLQPGQSRSYAVVPVEAIVEGNGKEGFVYVLADDRKRVLKKPVQIGFLDGDKVLLTRGLDGIAQVVTAGSAYLTEESTVLIK